MVKYRQENTDEWDNYMSVEELVELLDMSFNTVYSLCRTGVIPAKKMGRQWRISRQQFEQSMVGRGFAN